MNIPLTEIRPGRYQPRQQFEPGQLLELATSIRADGLLDPPIVWLNEQSAYELIGGERRWRAYIALALANSPAVGSLEAAIEVASNGDILGTVKRLGEYLRAYTMPVSVRETPDEAQRRLAIVHNIQRADLSPIEEARALGELRQAEKLSIRKLAEMVGKSKSWVEDRLKLLDLAPAVVSQVGQEGGLDLSVLREISRWIPELAQPALAEALAKRATRGATSQELVRLVGEIGRWADVERWIPAEGEVMLPAQYNRLWAIRTALVELPPVKLASAALTLAGNGLAWRDNYLVEKPAKVASSSWATDKILGALGSKYETVADERGWTCKSCHLAPLREKLGELFEGGMYSLPCDRLKEYARAATRCESYIGPLQPVVVEVGSSIATLVPEDSPTRAVSLKRADNFYYTESWQEYVALYHEAREASARQVQARAEEKKFAHLAPMESYWQAQQGETVFELEHFQAHACRKCEHFIQGTTPSRAVPCAWANNPKTKAGQPVAPEYAIMVDQAGAMVPRCSEFRYSEMPAIQRPIVAGFAVPDRELVLRWLNWLTTRNSNENRGLFGPLAWLPEYRAGQSRRKLDLPAIWEKIGDDDVMMILLDIAVTEARASQWANDLILRDNLGRVTEWKAIAWKAWERRDLPYGWGDWPKPWKT